MSAVTPRWIVDALERRRAESELEARIAQLEAALRKHHAHKSLTASDEDRVGYFVTSEGQVCKTCGGHGFDAFALEESEFADRPKP